MDWAKFVSDTLAAKSQLVLKDHKAQQTADKHLTHLLEMADGLAARQLASLSSADFLDESNATTVIVCELLSCYRPLHLV